MLNSAMIAPTRSRLTTAFSAGALTGATAAYCGAQQPSSEPSAVIDSRHRSRRTSPADTVRAEAAVRLPGSRYRRRQNVNHRVTREITGHSQTGYWQNMGAPYGMCRDLFLVDLLTHVLDLSSSLFTERANVKYPAGKGKLLSMSSIFIAREHVQPISFLFDSSALGFPLLGISSLLRLFTSTTAKVVNLFTAPQVTNQL